MNKLLTTVALAALVALPAIAATAAETTTAPARFTVIDADGRVIGELVTARGETLRLRVIGNAAAVAQPLIPAKDLRTDRTFHPDYSHALSAGQMSAAWQAELDRLFPPVVTGGG
jgi:hypothetical protein